MKIATRFLRLTRSGRPAISRASRRYLRPRPCSAFRSANSGFVSRARTADMIRDVTAGSRGSGDFLPDVESERLRNSFPHDPGKADGNSIADLARGLRSRSLKGPPIRESLDPSALADRHVSVLATVEADDVLSAGHPMHTGLDGLGRPVKLVSSVAFVETSPWDADMVRKPCHLLPVYWCREGRRPGSSSRPFRASLRVRQGSASLLSVAVRTAASRLRGIETPRLLRPCASQYSPVSCDARRASRECVAVGQIHRLPIGASGSQSVG